MRESQNTHSVHEHVTTESTKTSVNPLGLAGVLALFGTVLGANPVRAHSASEVGFDEADDLLIDRRSSVHYDMVRALARCAGFSASSAETIANVSQAMDFNSEDDPALFGVYGQEYFGTGSLLNENNDAMHFANIEFSSVVSGSNIEPALDFIKDWADGTVTTLVNPSSDPLGLLRKHWRMLRFIWNRTASIPRPRKLSEQHFIRSRMRIATRRAVWRTARASRLRSNGCCLLRQRPEPWQRIWRRPLFGWPTDLRRVHGCRLESVQVVHP